MSLRTIAKTVGLTVVAMIAGTVVASLAKIFLGPIPNQHETAILAAITAAVVGPLFVFPLLRKSHLLDQAIRDLASLAVTDTLTGALNRRGFEDQGAAVYAESETASVLMIDIDRFKDFNDTYGHAVGDRVLVEVAHRLSATLVGETAILGRIGGEEFAVVVAAPYENGLRLGNKMRAAVREFVSIGVVGSVTVSIGIAEKTAHLDFEEVLILADKALYDAKASGRDRVVGCQSKAAAKAA